MRKFMVPILVGVLACSAYVSKAWAQEKKAEAGPLDGTKWSVTLTPDEVAAKKGEKAIADNLVFRNSKISSSTYIPRGFHASEYTATQQGQACAFESEQTNATGAKTQWKGEVTGDVIKGTMTWTKKNGQAINYAFEGKKKVAK